MQKNESGQIIVILAVALVAILGITALAVDGSMIYAERRDDQTTADSAAMAGAQAASASTTCAAGQSQAIYTAQQYASQQEGVALLNNGSSPNRVEATCNADNSKLTIKVVVTSNTPTTFAKMISRNQLQTRVESTSQVTFGGGKFAGGNGLYALGSTCGPSQGNSTGGGIVVSANNFITIKGGGAYSASCIFVDNSTAGLMTDGAPILYAGRGSIQFYKGSQIEYTGTNGVIFQHNARAFILSDPNLVIPNSSIGYQLSEGQDSPSGVYYPHPGISQAVWPIPTTLNPNEPTIPDMVAQTCNGPDYGTVNIVYSAAPVTLHPGTYNSINQAQWTELKFDQGVYCIRDNGFVNFASRNVFADNTYWYFMGSGSFSKTQTETLNLNNSSIYLKTGNFTVSNGANLIAANTTIYIEQGNFTLSGNVPAKLTAPDCISTNCDLSHAIPGVAIYIKDKNNTGSTTMIVEGSSSLDLRGTIFVPKTYVGITGNSGLKTLHTQIISRKFEITGSSGVTLDLANANLYSGGGSPSVELLK